MIEINNSNVSGWEAAIRGMRNPMNSWDKSDSEFCKYEDELHGWVFFAEPIIGEADLKLMRNLVSAGSDHRKFMRFITVSVDINAQDSCKGIRS